MTAWLTTTNDSAVSSFYPLVALLTSVFLLISGNALVSVVVPIHTALSGFSDLYAGLLGSAYYFGMLLGSAQAPALVARVGHIRAFAACVALAAVAIDILPAAEIPIAWLASRALLGFVLAGVYAIIESWINAFAGNHNRGSLYGIYQIVNFAASAAGQLLMRGLDPTTFLPFTVGSALSALAIVPLSLTKADAPQIPAAVKLELAMFRRLAPVALAGAFVAGACNGAAVSLAPVYALRIGVAPQTVPFFTSAIIIGSALGVYPAGRLSDRMDRRLVVALAMGAGAILELALAIIEPTGSLLIMLGFLVGLTTYTLYTLIVAIANDGVAPREMVAISASMLFVYCVGAILSPTTGSGFMQIFGPAALFWQSGLLHGALAIFALFTFRRGRSSVSLRPQ